MTIIERVRTVSYALLAPSSAATQHVKQLRTPKGSPDPSKPPDAGRSGAHDDLAKSYVDLQGEHDALHVVHAELLRQHAHLREDQVRGVPLSPPRCPTSSAQNAALRRIADLEAAASTSTSAPPSDDAAHWRHELDLARTQLHVHPSSRFAMAAHERRTASVPKRP
jgi:hypothetical protein